MQLKEIMSNLRINRLHFVCTIILFLCSTVLNAQGPNAPEAASFEPVDATDMVNLLTGDLSYVLPLLEVPSPEGGYPITLSYHAGIAMEQEASWVGLGWTLNPGAINRSVSGVPDDWNNGLSSVISKDIGGTISNSSLFVGVGWGDDDENSIGVTANWQAHRAFGGETQYSYNINAGANVGGNSYGVGYSSNGSVSANYNNFSFSSSSGLGLNYNASYTTKSGDTARLSLGLSQKNGIGISISSNSGSSISLVGGSSNNSGSSSNAISRKANDEINVNLNLGIFTIKYSNQSHEYWHYDEKTYNSTGALYAGKLQENLNNTVLPDFHSFDVFESVFKSNNPLFEAANNNPIFMAYDKYDISAQGILSSISPHLFDYGLLHQSGKFNINKKMNLYGKEIENVARVYKSNIGAAFNKSLANNNSKGVYFYTNNEYSTYYRAKSNNQWNHPNNNQDGNFLSKITLPLEEITSEGFNSNKGRLKKGSYIETFTNKELLANSNIILNNTINRNTLEEDGIGAFKIIKADGMIYYFTIPVYQKAKFTRVTKLDENIANKYSEEQSLSPYATHWLLTAITGPDYIDFNNNNIPDESDYGYWVSFDYGKWSDGFSWRIPLTGYNYAENSKSYSWGVKEIYYLNSIKTRTHTAFFVKEIRDDYQASKISFGKSRSNPVREKAAYISWDTSIPRYQGTDGNSYFPGAYSSVLPSSVLSPHGGSSVEMQIDNSYYAEGFSHKALRLKNIYLIENGKIPQNLNTDVDDYPVERKVSDFDFNERVQIEGNNRGGYYDTGNINYFEEINKGEYFKNVLDTRDVSSINLNSISSKTIVFSYDYSLLKGTPNSTSNKGKTTLKSVLYLNKKGTTYIPPYKFLYNSIDYDRSSIDDWGYSTSGFSGSLKRIKTPTGGYIHIGYEKDDYGKEAARKSIVFDHNLKLKFIEDQEGNKFLKVRKITGNSNTPKLDFRNYYDIGNYEYIDVQYWWNPKHDGSHRIADIAKECLVTSVSNSEVTFRLPNTGTKDWVRRDYDCENQDWVYYSWYNEVVDRTSNWREELREYNCEGLGNDKDKVKIKLFSSLNKKTNGGGIRVNNISTDDGDVKYFYNTPGSSKNKNHSSYVSSGVTSFSPSKYYKEIPYSQFIPSPGVMYEYVTVERMNSKTQYKFNVLQPFQTQPLEYSLGDYVTVKNSNYTLNNIPRANLSGGRFYPGYKVHKQSFEVGVNIENMGALKEKKIFNTSNQLLEKTENNYKPLSDFNNTEKGIVEESFPSMEVLWGYDGSSQSHPFAVNLGLTSKIIYPSVLESTTTTQGGFSSTTTFNKHDFLTGQVLETTTTDSKGNEFKTEITPAYTKSEYNPVGFGIASYGMGSKVDNPTNKNMLTQEAMTKTYIKIGDDWKETSANITTWNNDWTYTDYKGDKTQEINWSRKIWRKHKTYVWDGAINKSTGIYEGFTGVDDNFNWAVGSNTIQSNNKWRNTSTTTQYDHYSMPLEAKDINNNYASTKMCDDNSKVLAVSNAAYTEVYYSGAEYLAKDTNGNNTEYFDGQVKATGMQPNTTAHTGTHIVRIAANQNAFEVSLPQNNERTGVKGKFKVSVWVRKGQQNRAKIKVVSNQIDFNPNETIIAGDWVMLNGYITIPTAGTTVAITSTSGSIDLDDFRLHPVASSMTSYVYNEWDELTFLIGANNLSTCFVYDAAGRLIETQVEVINEGSITGGFKKVSENSYNYKR